MFDFLGKKPTNKDSKEPQPQSVPGSLLDVVVPFPATGVEYSPMMTKNSSYNSLLSQFDVLAQDRKQVDVEIQAVERAELRAKKALFERSEQLARIEAERDASLRFEEKANKLAAEIERVRGTKLQQSNGPGSNIPGENYSPSYGEQPHHRNAEHYNYGYDQSRYNDSAAHLGQPRDRYQSARPSTNHSAEEEQTKRFQQWQQSSEDYHSSPIERGYRQSHASTHDNFDSRGRHYSDHYYENNAARPARPQEHGSFQPQYQRPPITPSPAPYCKPVPETPVPAQSNSTGGLYGQNQATDQVPSVPSLDLDKIFRSILGFWKLIGMFAVAGAVIAGVYAKSLPNKYQAWAELLIDPQGITLVEKQLSSTGYGGEAMIAYLESQLRIIESTSVLNVVADKEKLYNDPEFLKRGSIGPGLLNILNPLSSGDKRSRSRQYVIDNLQENLTIARGNRTFVVAIGMMTEDGEKSARIANAIAKAYVNGESGARSKVARDASENLSDKLETLRNRVLAAERKVADYKAENGLVTSEGKLISEVQLSRISEQLAVARVETVNAKTRMEQLQSIDLSDVISGALPASLNTGTLSQFRIRYATLKSTSDRLSTKLGPKHPERIAASAELESARGQISREIRRSIAGSQKDLERAKKRQKGLNQQLNIVKAAVAGTGNSQIALRELEREFGAHQSVYENYLLRSRETSEQEGLITTNARVISMATAPLEKSGPNRKVFVGVGLIAGGLIGLIFAMMKGMLFAKNGPQSGLYENTWPQPEYHRMNNQNYPYPEPYAGAGNYPPHPPGHPPRYTRPY